MEKEPKNWSEHPAYKEEDLEIKNEEELEKAKEMAGVTSHDEAIKRHQQYDREASLGQIMQDYFDMKMALRKNNLSEAEELMYKINHLGVPVINVANYGLGSSGAIIEKLDNDNRFISLKCRSNRLNGNYYVLNPGFLRESDKIIKEYRQKYNPDCADFAATVSFNN